MVTTSPSAAAVSSAAASSAVSSAAASSVVSSAAASVDGFDLSGFLPAMIESYLIFP